MKLPGGGSTVFSLAASDSLSLLRTKVAQVNITSLHTCNRHIDKAASYMYMYIYCTVLELNCWQSMYKKKMALHTPK